MVGTSDLGTDDYIYICLLRPHMRVWSAERTDVAGQTDLVMPSLATASTRGLALFDTNGCEA